MAAVQHAVLHYTSLILNVFLTCSFWRQGLCVKFSLLLGTSSPWKFANTFREAVFAHLRSEGQSSKSKLIHHEKEW